MARWAILVIATTLMISSSEASDSTELSQRIRRQQAAVKERQARIRREQEEFKRKLQAKHQRVATPVRSPSSKRRSPAHQSKAGRRSGQAQLAAQIAQAPSPEVCLNTFITTVRQAQSMSQVVPLLSRRHRESYQRKLASYDPRSAMQRRRELLNEGRLSEELILRMTRHPYEGELKSFREKAAKYYGVKSVKITGTQAKVLVYSHSEEFTLSNGKRPTAYFGLVFEDGFWRYSEYNYSLTVIRST